MSGISDTQGEPSDFDPAAITQAAALIAGADALVIAAGAGMGVDSGLPDFRGNAGFWRAYPALAAEGVAFMDIASPRAFRANPRRAWGFYGHRLVLYRQTIPHAGFGLLRKWGEAMQHGYFVFTSNVDGLFQQAGLDPLRVDECHGSIHHLQCLTPCSAALWGVETIDPVVDTSCSDVSNGYVLLATACDGTLATTAQFTSVRVVCNNTLAVALGGREKAVKVPHRTDFDPVAVKRQLGISVSAWDSFMYTMKALSDRKVNDADVSRFLRQVFSDESKEVPVFNERAATATKLLFDGAGRGAELQSAKGTAFGLLNSVTEFVDHMRRARGADYRLESAWFGQGASLKQKALDQSLAMIA